MAKAKTVEEYVEMLDGWQKDVAADIRKTVHEAAPDAKESIKWAQPVYEDNGPFAYFRAFKSHLNFGFWRGVDLSDTEGILEGSGDKMRHVKLSGPEDFRGSIFAGFVREAVELNRAKGDPTKGG
ncbi:MAG: DUF1801 domain-containing protein [Anaerolineae bacterium]